MAYGSTLHVPPTNLNYHLLFKNSHTTHTNTHKTHTLTHKTHTLTHTKLISSHTKYRGIFWRKKVRRMDHYQKNDKANKATALGRRTREEIGKEKSNDSPEITNRKETPDMPNFCLGVTREGVLLLKV